LTLEPAGARTASMFSCTPLPVAKPRILMVGNGLSQLGPAGAAGVEGGGGGGGGGGVVAGYAYCSPWKSRPAYRHTVENSIYVAPWAGRRGAGGLLLAALLDGCVVAGVREVIAVIADTGDPASVQLHTRHGFLPAGRLTRVGFKHGSWLDTVLLQRSLG
jgi:hypothetical protein